MEHFNAMSTTQDLFKSMISDYVAPTLRNLGFNGSGQVYCLPDYRCWAMLGIQKSGFSDRDDLRFTVNLSVTNKGTWEEKRLKDDKLPRRPAANTRYGSCQWSERIGGLTPDGEDHWWRLAPTTSVLDLADEVTEAIRRHGLPALRHELARWA